jgi:helix-turn-helix protein
MYRESAKVQKRAAALKFPETMRVVTEYLQDGASESEKKLIVSALMEGLRLIRKAAKQEADGQLRE